MRMCRVEEGGRNEIITEMGREKEKKKKKSEEVGGKKRQHAKKEWAKRDE